MNISIPRHFQPAVPPPAVQLTESDVLAMVEGFPAEVILSTDSAELDFSSARAAADFALSLGSDVPYEVLDMDADERALFEELVLAGTSTQVSDQQQPTSAYSTNQNLVAKKWGIAAFVVAVSGSVVAVAALVIGIVALAS